MNNRSTSSQIATTGRSPSLAFATASGYSKRAARPYRQRLEDLTVFYHVTTPKAAAKILKRGLSAGTDGHIYLLSTCDLRVVSHVALNQIFTQEVVILEVCVGGIEEGVEPDDVAELFAGFQWRVNQPHIERCYITEISKLQIAPEFAPSASVYFSSNANLRSLIAEKSGGQKVAN